jgi:hypothetical protein
MQPGDYERLTQQLQDAYSKDQQFATSYNQLFQNYLSMNVNLIDMLRQVQANTFSGIQQGVNQANQQYMQQFNTNWVNPNWGPNVFNIPNVNDMNSAINAQHLQQTIDFANQHYGMTPEQWEQYQEQQNEGSAGG